MNPLPRKHRSHFCICEPPFLGYQKTEIQKISIYIEDTHIILMEEHFKGMQNISLMKVTGSRKYAKLKCKYVVPGA